MRISPSIVPDALDYDVYLVLNDFAGAFGGLAWPETDVANTDRATLIRHLLEGQYSSPVRIVAFNTADGWSRASDEIAAELAQACADRDETPPSIADFIADHIRPNRVR
jgi:hypothetical protein